MQGRKTVEVRVRWGDALLEVEHLSPERAAERAAALPHPSLSCEIHAVALSPDERFGPARMDRAPWIYVGGTLALTSLALLAATFLPPSKAVLTLDQSELATRNVRSLMMEELPEQQELPPPSSIEGDSPVQRDVVGRAGTTEARVHRRRREAAGPRTPRDDHGARSIEVGTLAALRRTMGAWSSESPFAGSSGGHDALASLMGDRLGDSFGFGGLSLTSTGRGAGVEGGTVPLEPSGGGGTGSGSVCGCGEPGTIGRGSGVGTFATRVVEPELRERESRVPSRIVSCGCAHLHIRGGLSRDVIRRVVRRHHEEVRHCYEQGLQVRPDLEGRVATRFVIAATGEVVASTVESSTLQYGPTEMCIAAAVRRWTFPAVEDGAITQVSYPFVLESR